MAKATNATAANEAQQLTATNTAILKSVLKHCEAKLDFKAIGNECGVKNADVKNALGKWGLIWKDGKISSLDDDSAAPMDSAPAQAAGTKRKGSDNDKPKAAIKKSKTKTIKDGDDTEENGEEDSSST